MKKRAKRRSADEFLRTFVPTRPGPKCWICRNPDAAREVTKILANTRLDHPIAVAFGYLRAEWDFPRGYHAVQHHAAEHVAVRP